MNAALPTSIDCRPSVVRGILAPWDQVEAIELINAPMPSWQTRR